jgi:hypothetical protein
MIWCSLAFPPYFFAMAGNYIFCSQLSILDWMPLPGNGRVSGAETIGHANPVIGAIRARASFDCPLNHLYIKTMRRMNRALPPDPLN